MKGEQVKTAAAVIGGVAVFVALCVGGWFLYWDLFSSSTHRTAQIIRHNYEAQQTYRDEVERQVAAVRSVDTQVATTPDQGTRQALSAQRSAMVDQLCTIARRVDGGFAGSTSTFITNECNRSQP